MRSLRSVVFLLLGLMFVGAAWASYSGLGVTKLNETSLRSGSLGGPRVIGGGPRSGK